MSRSCILTNVGKEGKDERTSEIVFIGLNSNKTQIPLTGESLALGHMKPLRRGKEGG